YWTIGAGAQTPATAISAHDASFAQGLLEAMVQIATGSEAVLLVAYDGTGTGPLGRTSPSSGLLGGALLLVRDPVPGATRLSLRLGNTDSVVESDPVAAGPLAQLAAGNAMTPMLPVFEALALRVANVSLAAGAGRVIHLVFDDG
ncbi:MAG: beta-ketoacyl synthase chain length factor, partial [Dokdonella sp.]